MGTDDHAILRSIAVSFAVVAGCYAIFPTMPTLLLAAMLVFAAHCGGGAQWTLSTLGLQGATPAAIRGRGSALTTGW